MLFIIKNIHSIYFLINRLTKDKYVGRTQDLEGRTRRHFREMENGKHHNVNIQNIFNLSKETVGKEVFFIEVKESNLTLEEALEREQYYLDNENNLYNINMSSTFGDSISKHPQRDEILNKIGISSKERILNMTPEEKELRYGHTKGMGNPNYKNRGKNSPLYGVKKPPGFAEMVSRTHKGKILSEENLAKLKSVGFQEGNKPWNKGLKGAQKWTKEQHEKRSEGLPQNRKKVYCEGKIHDSLTIAAKAHDITPGAMNYRINSVKDKFSEFYFYK